MNMQALFERIGVPAKMMDLYMEQSKTLSIAFLAQMDDKNAAEKNDLALLGFNNVDISRMIVESKKIKGKNINLQQSKTFCF